MRIRYVHKSSGWYGFRLGRRYFYPPPPSSHRLLFSERNRHGCRLLGQIGEDWQLWLRTDGRPR